MNVMVTGATGFIGKHLVSMLVEKGYTVHAICRQESDASGLVREGVKVFRGDILDRLSLQKAAEGCSQVYHLAAYAKNWAAYREIYFQFNVLGLRNVIEAALCGGVRKIVYTSSVVTLGPSNGVPTEESSIRKVDFFTDYERSKAEAEKIVKKYIGSDLEIVTVFPTRVFGPGVLTEANSATKLIALYALGKWRLVPGDGNATGNYAYVEDVARGHILAMEKGIAGQTYILGGENLSYNEFFSIVSTIARCRHYMIHVPNRVSLAIAYLELFRAKIFASYPMLTPGWMRTYLIDWSCTSNRAEHDLGYKRTPFKEAVELTLDWINRERKYVGEMI